LNQQAIDAIEDIGGRIATLLKIFQRILVAIQRGNVVSSVNTFEHEKKPLQP